jgi:hypothetical protein
MSCLSRAPIAAIVGIALVLMGCGGSSNNSSIQNSQLTQSQAQAVATAVSDGIAQALASAFASASAAATGKVMRKLDSGTNSGPTCFPTAGGESCDWPISATFLCPGGGTMSVLGNVSGSVTSAGNGSVQAQFAATPTNCSVDQIVLNGDPNVTVGGQIGIANWNPVWPLTGTERGGVSFGPNPSGICQFNLNFSVNSNSSCTVSGIACGQPVSGSC